MKILIICYILYQQKNKLRLQYSFGGRKKNDSPYFKSLFCCVHAELNMANPKKSQLIKMN